MIILFALLFLVLAFLGYKWSKKYLAPIVLIPLVWGGILLSYKIMGTHLYTLSDTVLYIVLVWVLFSLLGAYIFSMMTFSFGEPSKAPIRDFNISIRSLYYYLAIIGTIPLLYIAYKQGMATLGNFFANLRYANVHSGEVEYKYGIFEYTFSIAFVSMLIELFSVDKKKNRIYILIIINVLLALITMSKSSFFFLFLTIMFAVFFQYKISKKKVFTAFGVLLLIMWGLHYLRSEEKSPITELRDIYLFAGLPALDEVVKSDMHVTQPGIMSFRFFYTVDSKLFGGEEAVPEFVNDVTQMGYVFVPLPTNVFTVIGPFWWDFGWFGVAVFGFVIGALAGFLYKKSKQNMMWGTIAYSYFACTIILQFFGEYIFTNLSYTIQIILLILIAYKFNRVLKWR